MNGTQLGFWKWRVEYLLDSGGNFYFSSAPAIPSEGDTQLAYFAGGTIIVNSESVIFPASWPASSIRC